MDSTKNEEFGCETCKLRLKAEAKPKSFMARLWRWHTTWCPGWKKYVASLSEAEKTLLLEELQRKP